MHDSAYAHTLTGRPESDWHPLEEHLRSTAETAAQFATPFSAEAWARLAGLWHDLGKYSEAFQSYLRQAAGSGTDHHDAEMRGRVDHSTAGAQHAVAASGKPWPPAHLLAYCIAGHHAGLPGDVESGSGLDKRLKKTVEPYDAAPEALIREPIPPLPAWMRRTPQREQGFMLAFFTRMLFSSLVDADFLDTEAALNSAQAADRTAERPSIAELLSRLGPFLDRKSQGAPDTSVNRVRARILADCRAAAGLGPGFFSLEVPTGGGKTLSSLAFALEHAGKHHLRRVVYAIPFTSIIEQTADVFREALGDLGSHVLEHHGNLDPGDPVKQSARMRLASENFDAPLVVTTNVQLFESLFASRTSRCRKLHRLARSVIILDEVQSLPPKLLAPTLAALRELVRNYGATVVLCTATQPAIVKRDDFPIGIEGVRPIIGDPLALLDSLRRVSIKHLGKLSNEDLLARLKAEPRTLCIVNSRRHALDLFQPLKEDPNAFHLSASMCAAHRTIQVRKIKRRLASPSSDPCVCISTQVIEAGVDVDFSVVYRAASGLDSIAQAAGRCNREGLLRDPEGRPALGRAYVFDYDRKTYKTSPLIDSAAARFAEILPEHRGDLLSPAAVEAFFRLHYWMIGGDGGKGWDRGAQGESVLDCFATDPKTFLHAQFESAAKRYRLIDDDQTPVIVPYEEGRRLIATLESFPDDPAPALLRSFDRQAQRYAVGVRPKDLQVLAERGVLAERCGRFYLVAEAAYDEKIGLNFEAVGADADRFVV